MDGEKETCSTREVCTIRPETTFQTDGWKILEEMSEEGSQKFLFWGTGLLAREKAGKYSYYHSNAHGDIELLTEETGRVTNHYQYEAFGGLLQAEEEESNRFRYSGEVADELTGQYYLRARYYCPRLGRFTQEDSYRGDGLNLYAYCKNNPVNYIDPSGYQEKPGCEVEQQEKKPEPKQQRKPQDVIVLSIKGTEDKIMSVGGIIVNPKAISDALKIMDTFNKKYINILMHGGSKEVDVFGKLTRADKLADYLRKNFALELKQKKPIRLLSCLTGSLKNGFAKQLADELGKEVIAPDKFLFPNIYDNTLEIYGIRQAKVNGKEKYVRNRLDPGEWKKFSPKVYEYQKK